MGTESLHIAFNLAPSSDASHLYAGMLPAGTAPPQPFNSGIIMDPAGGEEL